jgi:glycosyltransferase involved in cell wall biosynthesis
VDNRPRGRLIHVLFLLTSQSVGGAETHAVSLVNGLDKTKFRVSLSYLKDQNDGAGVADSIDREVSVFCAHVVRKLDYKAVSRLSKFVKDEKVDILVCANPFPLLYATLLRLVAVRHLKIVEILHSTEPFTKRARMQMIVYRPIVWVSDLLVYVCESQQKYWASKGLSARSIEVVHNGVDICHFQNRFQFQEIAELRRRYGFSLNDYVIGVCGNLRPEKSQADLVRAVRLAREAGVNVKCMLIGDGPTRSSIEDAIATLDLCRDVVITGLVKDVRLAVSACDVMVVPSHNETFSMAALESMALGKPVVMSNVGGAAELIRHSLNGYLYPKGDIAALCEHVKLLANPSQRETLGKHAERTIHTKFSSEIMIRRYDTIFSNLVHTPNGSNYAEI